MFLIHPITRNIAATVWNRLRTRFGFLNVKGEAQLTQQYREKLNIRTPSILQLVNNLSGGNRQKVSIAKWLAAGCDVLIIDEPTVGVDIGAKEYIHNLIWKLAREDGKAIVLISSDMPEMIKLARRILVFRDRRIVGEVDNRSEGSFEEVSQRIGHFLA